MPSSFRTLLRTSLAALAVGLVAVPAAQASGCVGADTVPSSAAAIEVAKGATLCLLNEQRAAASLAPLRSEAVLERAATGYSVAMISQRVFAHVLPDGVVLRARLSEYLAPAGEWTIGENLGWGERELTTPASMVDAWMHSEGHRRNIMDGAFRDIGIGIVPGSPLTGAGTDAATYTTEFGQRVVDAAPVAVAASAVTKAATVKRSNCTKAAIRRVSTKRRSARASSCARAARAAARAAAARR